MTRLFFAAAAALYVPAAVCIAAVQLSFNAAAQSRCPICSSQVLYQNAPAFLDNPSELPKITQYPDPFVMLNGTAVRTLSQWNQHRTELRSLEDFYIYGHAPPGSPVSVVSQQPDQIIGRMVYRYFNLRINTPGGPLSFFVDLYVPIPSSCGAFSNGVPASGPYPVILSGEASWDPVITPFSDGNTNASVGQANLETLVCRGYAVAEFGRDNFSPDNRDVDNVFQHGVFPLYPYDSHGVTGYDWGIMRAWAWGYSRSIDFLETLPYIDRSRIAIIGHSRGGQTATIAGEIDTRVALTIDSQQAPSYYRYVDTHLGEQTICTNLSYGGDPGWYIPNLLPFANCIGTSNVPALPIDCPSMMGQIAPRALLITGATGAMYENPESGTRCYFALKALYGAFGAQSKLGLFTGNTDHQMSMGYWSAALDFADQVFFNYKARSAAANAISMPVSPTDFDSTPFANYLRSPTHTWTAPTLSTGG